jgi:trypsin-like peptidase
MPVRRRDIISHRLIGALQEEKVRNHFADVHSYVQRVKALVPEGQDVKEYISEMLDAQIEAASSPSPMGIVPLTHLSVDQAYASARIAAEYINDEERLAAKPEGIIDLGVIEWLLRPALPLIDGVFEEVASGPWKQLRGDIVRSLEKSVCRIDIMRNGYPMHCGTGFIVGIRSDGCAIIMTNAHVVDFAIYQGWSRDPRVTLVCDFTRFSNSSVDTMLPLMDQYNVHGYHDLALVYIEEQSSDSIHSERLPLVFAAEAPPSLEAPPIGVIGHPTFNSTVDPFFRFFGFGNDFGVKRFSPGFIRALNQREWRMFHVDTLLHDATTLSGSSGSCIIDLHSLKVVGLHFGGWPRPPRTLSTTSGDFFVQFFESNGAVPLWTLRTDVLLNNVTFL